MVIVVVDAGCHPMSSCHPRKYSAALLQRASDASCFRTNSYYFIFFCSTVSAIVMLKNYARIFFEEQTKISGNTAKINIPDKTHR